MFQSKEGKFIYQFYRERDNIFMENYERLLIRLDEEDIHNLRRAGKRVKALYLLFSEIDPEFNFTKRFQAIKDVFNTAGLYREIQVNLRTLNFYKPSPLFVKTFENFISNKKLVFKNQLVAAIEDFKPEKHDKSVKKVKKVCQQLNLADIAKAGNYFIKHNLDEIKQLLNAEHTEEYVHDIRIYLKRISPVVNLLQVLNVPGYTGNLLEIKVAEDKLGYWHDRVVLLESLRQMKKLYPLTKDLLTDFKWFINQLTGEHESFIRHVEELINPCISLLDKTIIDSSASDNL